MAQTSSPRRVTDLERSAFWIYGVTAMVMREPISSVVSHSVQAGFGNWQVRLELLRLGMVLLILSRLFLSAGLYFERVYMHSGASDLYPKRSYPVDFLAGLVQFLAAVAVATSIALHSRTSAGYSPFLLLVALSLIVDWFWLATSALRASSSVGLITRAAWVNTGTLITGMLVFRIARLAGLDPVFSEQTALIVLAVVMLVDLAFGITSYEALD